MGDSRTWMNKYGYHSLRAAANAASYIFTPQRTPRVVDILENMRNVSIFAHPSQFVFPPNAMIVECGIYRRFRSKKRPDVLKQHGRRGCKCQCQYLANVQRE